MNNSLGLIFSIICCVLLLSIIPTLLNKELVSVTEESLDDKYAEELAYKIRQEKELTVADMYTYNGTVIAYLASTSDAPIMISWPEIKSVLETDGKYVFTEQYVQLKTKSKTISLRIN